MPRRRKDSYRDEDYKDGELRYCGACGDMLTSSVAFCSACGEPISIRERSIGTDSPSAPLYTPGPAIVLLVGGCLAAISAFLPWLDAQVGIFSVSRNGIENGATDGWVGIGAGLILGISELIHLTQRTRTRIASVILDLLIAVAVGATAAVDIEDISGRVASLNTNQYTTGTIGVGVYLMAVAGVIIGIGAIWRGASSC